MAGYTSGEFLTKVAGIALLGGLTIEVCFYAVRWFTRKRQRTVKHEILFFPDEKPACKAEYTERQGCHNSACKFSHDETSFARLMRRLYSTRQTLDCIFCFTSPELADAVKTLYQRGVSVRVITDSDQVDAIGSQVGRFRSEGIQVRHDRTSYFMHHKFAIIDGQCLINGSFNWTRQAITGNNENVLITTDSHLVQPFIHEFRKLWAQFDPAKQSSKS